MRKSDLLAVFGTLQAIGDLFASFNGGEPITKGAVSQWDEEIPELREYQIRELHSDIDARIARAKRGKAKAAA
jgi:hypothetical protein